MSDTIRNIICITVFFLFLHYNNNNQHNRDPKEISVRKEAKEIQVGTANKVFVD